MLEISLLILPLTVISAARDVFRDLRRDFTDWVRS